jgi:iron complex outermembrane receptor protein
VGEPGVDHFKTAQHSIGYRFERRMSPEWTVRQNVRYATETVDYHSLYMTALHDDGRTVDRANFSSQQKARVLSADQNIEWRGRLAGFENTLVAGVDYSRAVEDGQNYLGAAPTLDIITPLYGQPVGEAVQYQDQRSTLRQIGVYVQDQLKFDGQYLLTLGGRHDRSRSSTDDRFNAAQSNQTDQASTGRMGLTWLGPNGLAPYLSYASSFRPVLGQSADGRAFVPEQGRQVELGVKWAPLDRAALLSAAVFNLRKDNVLTADPLHMETGAQIQRGQVRVRGLELEADVKLDKNWKANASLTALDAKITRNNDGNQGNRPSLVPRVNIAAWVERTFGEGWRGGLGVRRIGATYGDDANTFENPGVTLADAMLGYRHKQWDFALNVSNLSDKIYLGNCASDGTCIYAARRQAQLTARYVW